MEYILEAIVTFAAGLTYGTDDRPRHPAVRYAVRTIGLGGTILMTAAVLAIVPMHPVLLLLSPVIFLCLLIVFAAEYWYGNGIWSLVAGITGIAFIVVATGAGL